MGSPFVRDLSFGNSKPFKLNHFGHPELYILVPFKPIRQFNIFLLDYILDTKFGLNG